MHEPLIMVQTAKHGERILQLRKLLQEALGLHFTNVLLLEQRNEDLIVGWKHAPRAEDRDSVEQGWRVVGGRGPITHFRIRIEGTHIDGPILEL